MINKFVFALASSSVLICNLIHAKPVEFWSMDKSKNEMQKNYAKEEGEILNLFARKNGEEESPINLKSGKSLRIEWKDPMPQSFTISFWVKVDSYYNRKLSTEISAAQKREAASQIICSKKDSFLIEMSYGKLRFSLWLKNKKKLKKITLKSDSRNMLRAQIWNHLSISYDKKYLKLYLNGNEIASKETDGKLMENLNPLIFGSNNPEDSFVGSIEKFKIFDRIYNFKAEELGFVSGKTLKGPSLLETKHINMEVSKNFIPRYFRDKGKRPLIDYISLCEGKKAQLYMDNIHWKSDWKLKHSTLISGKENRRFSKGTLKIFPENGLIELGAAGKLENKWIEKIKLRESESTRILDFEFKRIECAKNKSVSIDVKFMRWVEEEGLGIFVKDSKGHVEKIENSENKIFAPGSSVIVAYWKTGDEMEISPDKSFSVSKTGIIKGIGGYAIKFQIHDLPKTGKINFVIKDTQTQAFKWNVLDARLNPRNAALHLDIGGMSLFDLEAFEGNEKQSQSGYDKNWNISRNNMNDPDAFKISGNGKIKTNWEINIDAKTNILNCSWKAKDSTTAKGLDIYIPYWLVGAPFKIKKESGEIIEKIGNIPMRFGANLDIGSLKKGDSFIFRPTETEEITLESCGDFEIESYRKKLPSLEKEKCPSWYKHGIPFVLDLYPPAGLRMKNSGKTQFGLKLKYKRNFPKKHEHSPNALKIPKEGMIHQYSPDGRELKIITPFWEIIHSLNSGGTINSIKFLNGSNKNMLSCPEEIYVETEDGKYSSINDKNAKFSITPKDKNKTCITINGILKTNPKSDSGIPYKISYEYNPGYIKRMVDIDFQDGVKGIKRIGMLKLDFRPYIDECQYRSVARKVAKAVFPGAPIVEKNFIRNGTFTLFRRGVEGIDFVYERDIYKWELTPEQEKPYLGKGFLQYGSSDGYYAVTGNSQGGPELIIEPYRQKNKPLSLSGKKSFGNYLGLPIIRKNLPKTPPILVFDGELYHPTEKELPFLAEMGVNAVLQRGYQLENKHVVCTKFGKALPVKPTKEEKKAFQKLKEKKKLYNSYGIKLIHYFATWAMDPMLQIYRENYKDWGVPGVNEKGEIVFWPPGKKIHYVPVCLESPSYRKFAKKTTKEWMDFFGYDGVYFCVPSPYDICGNTGHAKGRHLIIDGVMDFCKWYKKEYPNTIFTGFSGYNSSIMLNNYLDANWFFEELQTWSSYEGKIPDLERMSEQGELFPNINRIVDRLLSPGWRKQITMIDHKQYMSRALLCRLFPVLAWNACKLEEIPEILKYEFKVTRILKDIDQSDFNKFADWKYQTAAITDNPAVRCAVYWNKDEALLVIANSETSKTQNFKFHLNKDFFGWESSDKYSLKLLPNGKENLINGKKLFETGIADELDDYDFKIYKISKKNKK